MELGIIHIIWLIPTAVFLLMGVYNSIEGFTKPQNKKLAIHFYKQTFFIFLCTVISILIDVYIAENLFKQIGLGAQIANTLRFLLFPFMAYFLAIILGGQKDKRINKDSISKRYKH